MTSGLDNRNNHIQPRFNKLRGEHERERRAATRTSGTFNVILTPDSFARLPEYGGTIGRDKGCYRSLPSAITEPEDPDVLVLAEFEDSPYDEVLPNMQSRAICILDQVSQIESVQRDLPHHGFGDIQIFLSHWQRSVSKRLVSGVTLFDVECQECPVTRESRTFQPLYHAMCAVSVLDLALKGQQKLLPRAFQHYHRAIVTCITSDIKPTGSLIYLHYILFVFDICSPSRKSVLDGQMWAQHLQRLSYLAYSKDDVNELQAYLLSCTLYLDAQSCLAGNAEFGMFIQEFQMQESTLPAYYDPKSYLQHKYTRADEVEFAAACFALSNFMRTRFADLSQLASQIRLHVDVGHGDIEVHQQRISSFRDELRTSWNLKRPERLSESPNDAVTRLLLPAKNAFEFASLQYSAAMIYLHTSMYRGQRMHVLVAQRREILFHCRLVLAKASAIIESEAPQPNHVVFPVFLAGVSSSNDHDRNRAIGLIRILESTAIGDGASRSRQLLETICAEQRTLVQKGGNAAELDWISYAKGRGLVVLNMCL
ncbi:hypothetical protein D6D00_10327 [Aureobasidium pullulans]|nr:hypothetical protein D6D00_10327 [Aureobasidium pullulans]